jgi:hypothetical protein
MSNNENPANAPIAVHEKHWNQKGDSPRIRLAGGPFIDKATLATLHEWQARGVSYGELIDRLAKLAIDAGYDPVTETYAKKTKSQKAGLPRKK